MASLQIGGSVPSLGRYPLVSGRNLPSCARRSVKAMPGPGGCVDAIAFSRIKELEDEVARLREENNTLRRQLSTLKDGKVPSVASTGSSSHGEADTRVAIETASEQQPDVPLHTLPSVYVAQTTTAKSMQDSLRAGINWPHPGEKFWERQARNSLHPVASSNAGTKPVEQDSRQLSIVHLTAEMAPIAKVGGLGDVVTGLARACISRGHQAMVIMPFYESLPTEQIKDLQHERDFDVPKGYRWDGVMHIGGLRTSAFSGRIAGVPVRLLRPADWGSCSIFRGGRIYGGSYDEKEAYLYLCRACLEYLHLSGQQPHILQIHDWHAAAAALLYWDVYHAQGLGRPRVLLTIHNLENTGEVRQDEFAFSGVSGEAFAHVDKALDERTIGHNPERLNLMKGGIVYSNAVTTVSPTYAQEILDSGAGGWLRSTFNKPEIRSKFRGILNGIDAQEWDPACDPLLPANFSADAPEGKPLCKEFLQKGLGLEVRPNAPLVAVISRLVPQKGTHLMKAALFRTVHQGGQFVLLGSGHSDGIFKALAANEFKDHPNCRLLIMYSEQLAHQIYAAADLVLVPSMFEPCGLTQLIALRYGAVPLVRRTGGLADTVHDYDATQGEPPANGFTFHGTDEASMVRTVDRAMKLYKEKPNDWAQLLIRNMKSNVSWDASAKSYVDLYNLVAVA